MNEWLKKNSQSIKEKWGKWSPIQKGIGAAVVVVVIAAVILMARMSSSPASVRLFSNPINDELDRDNIVFRLNRDNVKAYVDSENYISVDSEAIARKYRSVLVYEGLVPQGQNAYSIFDVERWTRSDFNNTVNWKRATENLVKNQLENLDAIQKANVILVIPEKSLILDNQEPTTASVTLYSAGGAPLEKKQVRAIQNLIKTAVEGLRDNDITIVDGLTNLQINDFEGMEESDRLSNIEKEQKIRRRLETQYASDVLNALQKTFGEDRVGVTNVTIKMNMSERTSTAKEYSGIKIREDNPNTSYDDSEVVNSLVLSEETVNKSFTGTGYNPEGVSGVEGQNPPVMSDMSNVIGKSTEDGAKRNYALNEKNISEIIHPEIDRISISVDIDGKWRKVYDENNELIVENGVIKREYTPLTQEQIAEAVRLVQGAVGYNKARGDNVVVTNLGFNRQKEFEEEDRAYLELLKRNKTIMLSLIGVAVVLIAFILFRVISREIERRRRLAEEERIRQQEEERQRALFEAQQQGMEVTMSVEERKRAELLDSAVAMAKEHPEDVAMLLRTWLMEE